MKKKKIIYLIGSLFLGIYTLFFASCSTITKVTQSSPNDMKAYESGLVMRPLVADLEISDSRKSIEYIVPDYMKVKKDGKQNALLKFKTIHKCDYVVDPVFQIITKTGKGKETKITLSGYAATFSNIRQVDTLPKSIVQYNKLHKPIKELDYLNSFTEREPTMGFEVLTGAYNGAQFDKILNNSQDRFYIGFESYISSLPDISAEFYDKDKDTIMGVLNNKSLNTKNNYSIGLMREIPITNFLRFRLNGGLDVAMGKVYYSGYDISTVGSYIASNAFQGTELSWSSTGVRVGAALDCKVYKSFSLVFKAHYSQGLLNTLSKDDYIIFEYLDSTSSYVNVENYNIKKIKLDGGASLNLAAGLRIVF